MTIRITKDIGEWADPEDFAEMTDDEVVSLLQEDTPALLDGAVWEVIRTEAQQ